MSRSGTTRVRYVIVAVNSRARAKTANVVALRQHDVSDAELVARTLAGDRWAEDVLVRRHYPVVAGAVSRLLGDREEARDVTQDAFVAALSELGRLREPAAVRGWLVQIAVRKVHRRFRRRKLLRALGLGGANDEAGLAEFASPECSPERHAELIMLDRALDRLAIDERIAWSLRHIEGMQLAEVAVACECSLATVKRRVVSADRVIRAHVGIDSFDGALAEESEGGVE
jgi:RNA polymerase sigma-70 factor, ECF subfamily